ncbi:prenyltransferase [Lactobacillaceae bacterium L1_55_11]|nr:prenyltransferase [Lactobacillaceae bacterium L1_55_11]
MRIKQFFDLIEIRVVIPSLAPLLIGLLYSLWRYHLVNWPNTILLTVAAVGAHLAVNTFNRYEDNKRQVSNEFIRESGTRTDGPAVTEKTVLKVALALGIIAALAGILVALRTGLVTWVIGLLSFAIGYLYSAGPKPITNTPFGELVSGVTMGYFILVAQLYVNTGIQLTGAILLQWFLVSLPLVLMIASIMLANNIADIYEDIENGRHTIVYYLGTINAKRMLLAWAVIAYVELAVLVLVGWLPWLCLGTWALLPLVVMNINRFNREPIKEKHFILIIKNLIIVMLSWAVCLLLALI